MTKEKIISLARECGITHNTWDSQDESAIEIFYHQAQSEAFEAAAKLVDDMEVEETNYCMQTFEEGKKFQYDAVAAIREMAKENGK